MHIFFSGIGGSGLSSLAHLALDLGFLVSGSDIENNQSIENLKQRGAVVEIGQSLENIKETHSKNFIDWFVHTAALKENHQELNFVRAENTRINQEETGEKTQNKIIKISKRDEFINFIIQKENLKLIAIAGTHGKTTTTAMIVWLFKQLEIPVSYFIGSQISFGNSGHFNPKSQYFVLECDEFDRNFLNFHPEIAVIPSIDYDHPDSYPTREDYYEAFGQFLGQTQTQIIPASSVDMDKIRQTQNWQNMTKNHTIRVAGGFGELENLAKINLVGVHNRQNAELALFTVAVTLEIETGQKHLDKEYQNLELWDKIAKFPSTARRFEKLADRIYSDYAHHPSEIKAALSLAKELVDNLQESQK